MKRLIVIATVLMVIGTAPAWGGEIFPDADLTGTLSYSQKVYLGVSTSQIKVSDIKADYLFVEVYSMYCPICQADAPKVNELYDAISRDGRGDNIRFIGIGAGNTPFEIDFYRKKYNVAFPLFSDSDYVIHKALGEVGTPSFYLVKLKGGAMEILYSQEGEMKDEAKMFNIIIDKKTEQ